MSDIDIVKRLKECSKGLLEESIEMQEETGLGLATGWECIHGAIREIKRLRSDVEKAEAEHDRLTAQYAQVREDYTAWWKAWLHDHRSEDVAAWLRAYAKAMPDAHPDGPSEVQDILREINEIVTASADEITRLRADLIAAQEYRECAEIVAEERGKIAAKAIEERDEARRSCCEYAAIVDGADTNDGMESGRFHEIAMKYMKSRGWDCFKEVQR